MLCWWKIWLLSTSAFLNTHSYLPSPRKERSLVFSFSHRHPLSLSCPPPHHSAPAFPPVSFIYSPPLLSYTSLFYLFFQHSPVFLPSLHPSPQYRQPIQQQNKAAFSITHWIIKQRQNSTVLRSTQQQHDTGLH